MYMVHGTCILNYFLYPLPSLSPLLSFSHFTGFFLNNTNLFAINKQQLLEFPFELFALSDCVNSISIKHLLLYIWHRSIALAEGTVAYRYRNEMNELNSH